MDTIHITADGRKIPLKAISMLDLIEAQQNIEADFRTRGEPIDPPTYEVPVAGGGKIRKPLTPDILIVEGNEEETRRRQEAWKAHQEALSRMNEEIGRVTQLIILDGVDVQLPADRSWIERRKRRYLNVPEDDPDALLVYYKQHEVLVTPEEFLKVQNKIIVMSSSGAIPESAVEAAEAMFRNKIQEIAQGLDGRLGSAERDEADASGRKMDGKRPVQRAGRSKRVGNPAESGGAVSS